MQRGSRVLRLQQQWNQAQGQDHGNQQQGFFPARQYGPEQHHHGGYRDPYDVLFTDRAKPNGLPFFRTFGLRLLRSCRDRILGTFDRAGIEFRVFEVIESRAGLLPIPLCRFLVSLDPHANPQEEHRGTNESELAT